MLAAANDHRKSCLFGLRFLMICDHGTTDSAKLALAFAAVEVTLFSHTSQMRRHIRRAVMMAQIISIGMDKECTAMSKKLGSCF